MTNFGIPASERNYKPLIGPLVKTGEKRPGEKKPTALEYFKVIDSSGQVIPEFNDRPEEITVELVSDEISDFWRDALACYDGRTKFCGNDAGGQTAYRRGANGVYQPVECDPRRCALRLNETNAPSPEDAKANRLTTHQEEINGRWCKSYPYAHLTEMTKCKSQSYFLFALPHPKEPGKYITRPGEYARYASGSRNINSQLLKGLHDIWKMTSGKMRGFQVKLVMSFNSNAYGGKSPTVGIVGPDASDFPRAIREMAHRRGMENLDMDLAMEKLTHLTIEELQEVDAEYLYEHFYLGENKALPEGHETLALPMPTERQEIHFGTQDLLVKALCEHLRISYPDQTKLQMRFGADVAGYTEYLISYADQNKLDISSVLARFSSGSPTTSSAASNVSAPAPASDFTEVHDDDYLSGDETVEEPLADEAKDDIFADLKAKFSKDS
jgi:hypothetical protein